MYNHVGCWKSTLSRGETFQDLPTSRICIFPRRSLIPTYFQWRIRAKHELSEDLRGLFSDLFIHWMASQQESFLEAIKPAKSIRFFSTLMLPNYNLRPHNTNLYHLPVHLLFSPFFLPCSIIYMFEFRFLRCKDLSASVTNRVKSIPTISTVFFIFYMGVRAYRKN